jgi:SAM-dependent methyltransferase
VEIINSSQRLVSRARLHFKNGDWSLSAGSKPLARLSVAILFGAVATGCPVPEHLLEHWRVYRKLLSTCTDGRDAPLSDGYAVILSEEKLCACRFEDEANVYRLINLLLKIERGIGSTSEAEVRQALKRISLGLLETMGPPSIGDLPTALRRGLSTVYEDALASTMAEICGEIQNLWESGLLTVRFAMLEMGDVRRFQPMCPDFGFSRGTPLDRYYLRSFLHSNRIWIAGNVLDVGGHRSQLPQECIAGIKRYTNVDINPKMRTSVVGDIARKGLFRAAEYDCILALNVLEHCSRPSGVVDNLYRWLKRDGCALCFVPCSQRIHAGPKDYWRILPDALQEIFAKFADVRITSYGNAIAAISSLLGIAAEELSSDELSHHDQLFPVAAGVVAIK